MPLPAVVIAVLGGGSEVAAGLNVAAVTVWLTARYSDLLDAPIALGKEMLGEVEGWAANKLVEWSGLQLDKDDPFSDASFCTAIEAKTGIALRTLMDKAMIQADLETWGLAQLEEKTDGLKIKNPRDIEQTKKDLYRYVTPFASEKSGIPLTDLSDTEKTKAEMIEHAKDVALVHLADDIDRARGIIGGLGVDFDAIVKRVQIKGGVDPVTGLPMVNIGVNMIVLGILSKALIAADKRHRAMLETCDKQYARREARRESVRKFRAAHGHRMVYQPI